MDTNIWTAISTLIGALVGAGAAIAASYLSNKQQFEQKNQNKKNNQLKMAYVIADQLLNDTDIQIEAKIPLLKLHPRDPSDCCDGGYDPEENLYVGIANRMDRRKRNISDFFDINDMKMCEKLKQLCDLYTDDKTSTIASRIYISIKGLDAHYELAQATDASYESISNELLTLKSLLIELKQQIKIFISA